MQKLMPFKYTSKERLDWIKSIQSNFESQTWLNDKVYHPTDLTNRDFFNYHKTYKEEICPNDIIGIDYGFGYNCPMFGKVNIDWNYMLKNLRRLDRVINNFKDKERLVEHIHRNKDPKSVIKYGNHYFTTSGQHRMFLARSLELEKVKVQVHEYKLDKNHFIREKYLEKNHQKLIEYGFLKDNFINDIKEKYITISIGKEQFCTNKNLIKNIIERYEYLKKDLIKSNFMRLKSILNFKEQKTFIKTFNDLKYMDAELVNHIKRQKYLFSQH